MEIRAATEAQATQPAANPKLTSAALGFEQLLVQQLAETLVASTGGDDESADASSSLYRDMLPEALSESVKQAGGIGLAQALAQSLAPLAAPGAATAAPSGAAELEITLTGPEQ
jgi:Rod binding domain-containing protein